MRAFLLLALGLTAACGRPGYPVSLGHALLGHPVPQLHYQQTLDGKSFDSRQVSGKPVVIKFFADYCVPCKATLPVVERIHEEYPDIAFLGIDEDESLETARGVAQQFGLTFPVVHDQANVLSGRFRVSSMPMTFVADANGIIRWIGAEGQTEDELRRALEATR